MIKKFLDKNFLLSNSIAEELYFDYAESMPIIDYHNHLIPKQIAEDHQFENITQPWLYGDHYKWRAMRTLGISESYITGGKSDAEKFEKWAETVPYTLRNPLYHWTHLELQRYFQIDTILDTHSQSSIYEQCNDMLSEKTHSVLGLLKMMRVEVVCTTDDPTDDLMYHKQFNEHPTELKMFPSFRPDKFILIENENFITSVNKLSELIGSSIDSYTDLINALRNRADFFNFLGCRAADHGLEYISHVHYTGQEIEKIFISKMRGQSLSLEQINQFKTAILIDLGEMYHDLGWVQQFHLGALRNNNVRALREMGPDTGWDSIGDWSQATSLSHFLARLDNQNKLTKTVLYNLNPADNALMATMIGNFNDGSSKGKIQYGSSWWFLDQKDGMEKQINALSNMGMLSCFIGMLTDSRSFLSFPRHEYFRRILCNIFGQEIERGELPHDIPWVGKIIQDICYYNVKEYLNI